MMDPCFDCYEINVMDIWPYESGQFLNGNRSVEHIYNVKNLVEAQILKSRQEQLKLGKTSTIEPIVTIEDYDRNTQRAFWERLVTETLNAESLIDKVSLDYFNVKDGGVDSFFAYFQNIEIENNYDRFDFWFALKLSQYDEGLKYIYEFLKYHLKSNFNSKKQKFDEFLVNVLLQYESVVLSKKVVQVVENWKNIDPPKNNSENGLERRKYKGDNRTFLLKKVDKNPGYFKTEKNEAVLNAFWQELYIGNYINKTTIGQLEAIFKSGRIEKENRLIWTKSIKTLTEFVKKLIESNRVVELTGVDHWLITMDCFVLNKSKEIEFNSISKPQNEDSKLKGNIEAIVDKFILNLE